MGRSVLLVALAVVGLGAAALAVLPEAPRIQTATNPPPPVIDPSDSPAEDSAASGAAVKLEQDYSTAGWLLARITKCSGVADVFWCGTNAASFRDDVADAMRGDYGGIRNVSYCLQTSCDEAVTPHRVTGCAWRLIALAHPKSDSSDRTNWTFLCADRLGENDVQTATLQALKLYRAVYGNDATLTQIKRLIPRK